MKKLIYRRPRYRIDVPVTLRQARQQSLVGRCTDISSEGVGVCILEELPIGETLTIEFALGSSAVHANARVEYRYDHRCYGLKFLFLSSQERDSVARAVNTIQRIM